MKLGTFDAVTYLFGDVSVGMRRVLTRWIYNWARSGVVTNYGDAKKALWDVEELKRAARQIRK